MTPAGLPHSDTHGSTDACSSPWLFAACRVLPRLPAPRHPPCALTALDQFHVARFARENAEMQCTPEPFPTAAIPGPVHRYVSTYQRSSRFLDDPNHPNCQIAAGTEVPFRAAGTRFAAGVRKITKPPSGSTPRVHRGVRHK